eukprot:5048199-Amphidinium_carterae.1
MLTSPYTETSCGVELESGSKCRHTCTYTFLKTRLLVFRELCSLLHDVSVGLLKSCRTFLEKLCKLEVPPKLVLALDCGAGVGRDAFAQVDLLEPSGRPTNAQVLAFKAPLGAFSHGAMGALPQALGRCQGSRERQCR